MNRARRAIVWMLLIFAFALPLAAQPAAAKRPQPWTGLLAALRLHLAPIVGTFEKSRADMDPNGEAPPGGQQTQTDPQTDSDSRSSMDPDG